MAFSGTYADSADLTAYIAGLTFDDESVAEVILANAETDIDSILGGDPVPDGSERKLDPDDLSWDEARALKRATCAQFEYRLEMGEAFFVRPQFDSVSGPDFSTSGQAPYIGPKAMRELSGSGLMQNTTSVAFKRRNAVPPWAPFAWNLPDPTDWN